MSKPTKASQILTDLGLTGCVQPHSLACHAPFEADCPLLTAIDAHGFGLGHDGWLADCQLEPCLTRYAALRTGP